MKANYFNKPITKRFIDAFPKFENENYDIDGIEYFWEGWQSSPFYNETFLKTDMQKIYNHLLAEYYNWHYIYLDDLGISLNTYMLIDEFWENTKERISIVKQLREMSITEFEKSGVQIESTGSNPKITKNMDELIDLIDSQNASFQLKSKEQTLRAKFYALYDGIMDDFISKFKKMFVKLYSGVNNYLYINKIEKEEEEDV